MDVSNIMTRALVVVGPDDTLSTVSEVFRERGFHHVPVVEQGKLVGIVSDRDVLRALSPFLGTLSERAVDSATLQRKVFQVMTRRPAVVRADTPLSEVAGLMLDRRISSLPVTDAEGRLVGIVTMRDILRLHASSANPQGGRQVPDPNS